MLKPPKTNVNLLRLYNSINVVILHFFEQTKQFLRTVHYLDLSTKKHAKKSWYIFHYKSKPYEKNIKTEDQTNLRRTHGFPSSPQISSSYDTADSYREKTGSPAGRLVAEHSKLKSREKPGSQSGEAWCIMIFIIFMSSSFQSGGCWEPPTKKHHKKTKLEVQSDVASSQALGIFQKRTILEQPLQLPKHSQSPSHTAALPCFFPSASEFSSALRQQNPDG